MLHYEEMSPSQALREYIESYWTLETDFSLDNELCLPDGSASLIFNFNPPHLRATCSRPGDWKLIEPICLVHQGKEAILIKDKSPVRILGVRFKPYGMSPFFQVSMMDLPAPFLLQGNDLQAVVDAGNPAERFEDWQEKMLQTKDFSERIALLEEHFQARLPHLPPPDELAKSAVAAMVKSEGNLRIGDLLDELCVGKSTLEKKFQEAVGLSPKILCNILRFNSIIYNHARQPYPSLTELTYNQGFFDQAHLVHNFKAFTGMPPGRFFRQDNRLVEMVRQTFEGRVSGMYGSLTN